MKNCKNNKCHRPWNNLCYFAYILHITMLGLCNFSIKQSLQEYIYFALKKLSGLQNKMWHSDYFFHSRRCYNLHMTLTCLKTFSGVKNIFLEFIWCNVFSKSYCLDCSHNDFYEENVFGNCVSELLCNYQHAGFVPFRKYCTLNSTVQYTAKRFSRPQPGCL
jgi:hypothetical protein